jgi:hypothetical protein
MANGAVKDGIQRGHLLLAFGVIVKVFTPCLRTLLEIWGAWCMVNTMDGP